MAMAGPGPGVAAMSMTRIRAGRLFDGTGAPPIVDAAILIDGERIVEVGPAAAVPTPEHAVTIDFPEQTLLPGLVDCHSHTNLPGDGTTIEQAAAETDEIHLLRSVENARTALATGVTTLRENGAVRETAFVLREAIRRGIVQGPRLSVAGRPITVTGGHCWPMGGEADGVEGVRQAVRQLVKEGADWIKAMSTGGGTLNTRPYQASYTIEELRAIADEGHRANRLVGIHCTGTAGIVNALDAGADMLIHAMFNNPDGTASLDQDLVTRIVDRGVWVNPTVHVMRARVWRYERLTRERALTDAEAADLALMTRRTDALFEHVSALVQAGVKLAAGSDCGWSHYAFGGFRHEIEALATCGLGTAKALRSGTLDSADAMGLAADVGSLEPGKLADLLVVDGDPLADLAALGNVTAVFLGGRRV
jgi:imidazolonepropionase-like amidohydrolase